MSLLDLGIEALDSNSSVIELCGEKRKWTCEISYELALKYVKEGAARVVSPDRIVKRYDRKTIRQFVMDRDGGKCFFCGGLGDRIYKQVPKTEGGLRSPQNCVCACGACIATFSKSKSKGKKQKHQIEYAVPILDAGGNVCRVIENPTAGQMRCYREHQQISVYCDYSQHPNHIRGGYGVVAVGCEQITALMWSSKQTSSITHAEELNGLLQAIKQTDLILENAPTKPHKVVFYSDVGNIASVLKGEINRYLPQAKQIKTSLEHARGKYESIRFRIRNMKEAQERSYMRLAHRYARKAIGLR